MTSLRPSVARWLLAGVPVAVLATWAGLALAGAGASPLLADTGGLVGWAGPAVTVVNRLTGALILGGLMLLLLVLPPAGAPWRRTAVLLTWAGPVWAVVHVTDVVFSYAATAGSGIGGPDFGAELAFYLTEITVGQADLAGGILIAVTGLACVALSGYRSVVRAAVPAFGVLCCWAVTGHAAGRTDYDLALSAMTVHLLGVMIWAGALAVLSLVVRGTGPGVAVLVRRYGVIALCSYLLVGASGVVNSWSRLNTPADLGGPYGQLLLAKVALFVVLGVLGWWHRRRAGAALAHQGGGFRRFAGVEIVLLSATFGGASALAAVEIPRAVGTGAPASAAEEVSGRPVPPEPTVATWLTEFAPDLIWAVVVVAFATGYLAALVRLHRHPQHRQRWPALRVVAYGAGVLLAAWVLLGGPAVFGNVMFSGHLAAVLLLMLVVPTLLVLGAPAVLIERVCSGRQDGSRGPLEWLQTLRWTRVVRAGHHPVVAGAVLVLSLVVFYGTALLTWAMTSYLGSMVMTGYLAAVGYLFVNALIGHDPRPTRPSYGMRGLVLGAVAVVLALLGELLARTQILLAADYFGALGLPWGVDALADQAQSAILLWVLGGLGLGAIATVLLVSWAGEEDREGNRRARLAARQQQRRDRAARSAPDAELEAYEQMLSRRLNR